MKQMKNAIANIGLLMADSERASILRLSFRTKDANLPENLQRYHNKRQVVVGLQKLQRCRGGHDPYSWVVGDVLWDL